MGTHVCGELSALADIGHLFESAELPGQQVRRALALLRRLVPYDRCALLDTAVRETQTLVVLPLASPETYEELHRRLLALHELVSADRPLESRPLPFASRAAGVAHLALPLIALDRPTGILIVERNGAEYEEQHLQLLAAVAAQLGAYLTNVRLHGEGQRATGAMPRAADLLEHFKDGFLEVSRALVCVSANRAACELLGLAHAELVDADVRGIPGIGDKPSFLDACSRALDQRTPVHLDAMRYEERWLELELHPTELGVSVFLRDVSERRASDEFRELLMGIIGHDLRTPLGAISVTAATLLQRGGLDEVTTAAVERIARSGARIAEMAAQLLDVTVIRSGRELPLQRVESDLGQICHDVCSEVSAAHPGHVIRCEAREGLRGLWDPARLSQLISNLVDNAVQHGDRSVPVRLSTLASNGEVVVEVHNAGPPIPPELAASVFESFRRLPGTAARPGSLGLGLFIAQNLARAHGGALEVSSREDAGTTFTLRLPLRAAAPPGD